MQQKTSLGSNGLDWVRSLRKLPTQLRGSTFCINCTSSAHFAPSFMQLQNGPKCSQTLQNTTKGCVWGPMEWIGCIRCENIWCDFVARTFALIAPVQPILHRVWCGNEILPNAPKHYETHQNMSIGSIGVDWADLLQKILMQLCGLNFCINCNSSSCFEPSIIKQRNGPKCSQTLRNKTKHEFRVQWGWIGCIRCDKFGHDFVAWTFLH